MHTVQIIGIDPGPTTGLVLLRAWPYTGLDLVMQCNHMAARAALGALLTYDVGCPTVLAVEKFVVGRVSRASAKDGEITRNLVGAFREMWENQDSTSSGRLGGRYFERSAAQVKPWATDARLEAAGLKRPLKGMRHAGDAARHALYAAVHDARWPDPLSKAVNG